MFALARVFGNIPEDLFSRSDEQSIFRAVAKAGLGPKLLVCSAGLLLITDALGTMHCVSCHADSPSQAKCAGARQHGGGACDDALRHESMPAVDWPVPARAWQLSRDRAVMHCSAAGLRQRAAGGVLRALQVPDAGADARAGSLRRPRGALWLRQYTLPLSDAGRHMVTAILVSMKNVWLHRMCIKVVTIGPCTKPLHDTNSLDLAPLPGHSDRTDGRPN